VTGHGLAGTADAGAFLARLTRLDPATVVRLRSGPGDQTALWARLPWSVVVSRLVAGAGPGDATVPAAGLLAELERGGDRLPERRDADWRWPLPPDRESRVLERIPAAELLRIAESAAGALRAASAGGVSGRAVGERLVRDALLDHVAIEVTDEARGPRARVEVSQRLVQAVVRMGFLGHPDRAASHRVLVRTAGRWVGLSAPYGSAWLLRSNQLVIHPARRSNG